MTFISAEERFERARAAQANWAKRSSNARKDALARLRKRTAANRELLVNAIVADTGKPALDALGGDVLVTLEQMLFYEKHSANLLAPRRVGRSLLFYGRTRFSEHFEAHGAALVIGPANYPLQLCLAPAATALYAGNAVVVKVSEKTPAVARAILHVVESSDLPADLLQICCVGPGETGDLIQAMPDFVFFTGSSKNGRSVASRAGALGIPTLLELGGSDAALVFADCDIRRTIEGIAFGAFSNAGQVCVGIKRLFVEHSLYDRFVSELVRRSKSLVVGAGHNGDLGCLPSKTTRELFRAQVHDALDRGARLETAGSLCEDLPVILSNVSPQARLLREESFGPVLCVQPFATETEAVALANRSAYALGASIWTRDFVRARRVAHALNAGSCSINDVIRNIANPHAAFGGNGSSGYGRYHGAHGLYAFSRIRTVMENRTARDREVNWFPFTRKKYEQLDTLIELRHRPGGLKALLRRAFHVIALTAILTSALGAQGQAAHLVLQVQLPANAHGRIAYLVFNSPNGFPKNMTKAVISGFYSSVGREGNEKIDVGELAPGRYAVSLYLDENGNGRLDSGFFGIPTEPVGVSNNPRSRMGPPRFEDGAFSMGTKPLTISITLVRPG